ncbi:hypothetical protein F5X99DRAFT_431298 [Biscogniauxia marginata]|nr:hypothetical protein F5X99DRAFT_431298 [Biscogniauxia marginata]
MSNDSREEKLSSGKLIDFLKRCDTFNDLPDDSDQESRYVVPNPPITVASMTETDKNILRYEEYLRTKWQCLEAMPASFDPEKLEIVRKTQFGAHVSDDGSEQVDITPLVSKPNHGGDIHETALGEQTLIKDRFSPHENDPTQSISTNTSITESLYTEEQLEGYESDASIKDLSIENINRVRPHSNTASRVTNVVSGPIEAKNTPRIKAGSKPPLSRSAFARGGEPGLDESSKQLNGSTPLVYPRAPRYFPFKSRAGKK